jgi:hypothetical protein
MRAISVVLAVAVLFGCGQGQTGTTTTDARGSGSGSGGASDGGTAASDAGASNSGRLAYKLIDLGPGFVNSIDDRGRVAGQSCSNPGAPCAGSIYTPGSGWAPVPVPNGANYVEAIGIDKNDNLSLNAWFPYQRSSYRRAYTTNPLSPLPTASQPPQTTFFNAVQPATGHRVGYDEALGGAFLYDGTTITPIAVQPGKSYENSGPSQAIALNVHDQVVGWMRPTPRSDAYNDTPAHAFLWEGGIAKDLGSQGTCDSIAVGINASGLVAGMIGVGIRCGESQVFTWDGQMHVVGCPKGAIVCRPYSINSRGDIVGNALASVLTPQRAFIYRDGEFRWLDELVDASGWTLEYPKATNDAGQIAGWGTLKGVTHAFVLTPR